jgi:hypothetical protein
MKRFLTITFVIGLISSCNMDTPSDARATQQTTQNHECDITRMIVPEIILYNKHSVVINKPVALTFFNLNKLIAKYDGRGEHYSDSLPEKLRGNARQEIYRNYDIAGMYGAIIKPILDSMSIHIVDTVTTAGLISFNVKGKLYAIDKALYKETDGVLFYNGKDKPIFWTEGIHREPKCIIKNYY